MFIKSGVEIMKSVTVMCFCYKSCCPVICQFSYLSAR